MLNYQHLLDSLLTPLHSSGQSVGKGGGVKAIHQKDKRQAHLARIGRGEGGLKILIPQVVTLPVMIGTKRMLS